MAQLSSAQLGEIEAYMMVERDPEGPEGRAAKEGLARQQALDRTKGAFKRAMQAVRDEPNGNRSNP